MNLVLPVRGIDQHAPAGAIPPGFCHDALNMRSFDPATDRRRLSKRAGSSKHGTLRPSGVAPVKAIAYANGKTFPTLTTGAAVFTEDFASVADWTARLITNLTSGAASDSATVSALAAGGSLITISGGHAQNTSGARLASYYNTTTYTLPAVITCDIVTDLSLISGDDSVIAICIGAAQATADQRFVLVGAYNNSLWATIRTGTTSNLAPLAHAQWNGAGPFPFTAGTNSLKVEVAADWIRVSIDGVQVAFAWVSNLETAQNIGLFMSDGVAAGSTIQQVDNLVVSAGTEVGVAEYRRVFRAVNGAWDYRDSSSDWAVVTGGSYLAANRPQVALAPGDITQTGEGDKRYLYVVDGDSYRKIDATALVQQAWTASASNGSLPNDSATGENRRANLIAWFQNRIWLAGTPTEPYVYYASRKSAPNDWDYADTDDLAAFAGNITTVNTGTSDDVIRALIPHSDDFMFMGCAKSIVLVRGDPRLGGSLDAVVRDNGVVGPGCAATDDEGFTYLLTHRGIMPVSPGATVGEIMTKGRVKRFLDGIDYSACTPVMTFDQKRQLLMLFFVCADADADVRALVWDKRADAFWIDSYPLLQGPTAAAFVPDAGGDTSTMLLGGWDGHVRMVDGDEAGDDGEAIDAYCDLAVITGEPCEQALLSGIGGDLSATSGAITLSVARADSPDEVLEAATKWSFSRSGPGKIAQVNTVMAGCALRLRIAQNSATDRFSVERIKAVIERGGMVGSQR